MCKNFLVREDFQRKKKGLAPTLISIVIYVSAIVFSTLFPAIRQFSASFLSEIAMLLRKRKVEIWRLGRFILIDIADQSRRSWKMIMAWATVLFAQGLYEFAPSQSYISIKPKKELIRNAQGVTFLLEINELASNWHRIFYLWPPG